MKSSLSPVGDWHSTTRDGVTQTRTHTPVHETTALITAGAATALLYDANGNLTQDEHGQMLTWDHENRLRKAVTPATVTLAQARDHSVVTAAGGSAAFGSVATYRYDAFGRRVQKTVFGRQTTFVCAGAQVLTEYDAPARIAATSSQNDDGVLPDANGATPNGGILNDVLVRVNFQPPTSPIPDGFVADKGRMFGTRSNGLSYGWDSAREATTVARGMMPLAMYDTHQRMKPSENSSGGMTNSGTWRIALDNGTYAVAVVMGDPTSMAHTNHLMINGVTLLDSTPATTPSSTLRRGNFDVYVITANVTERYKRTYALLSSSLLSSANPPSVQCCLIDNVRIVAQI